MVLPDIASAAFPPLLELCKRHIHTLSDMPELMCADGFAKTAEVRLDRSGLMTAIGFENPERTYAITCYTEGGTKVKSVALSAPDANGLRNSITETIRTLPNLVDRTRDTHRFAAAMPADIRTRLSKGQFWSTKAIGECGLNIGICPSAIWPETLDFVIERNLALEDRLTTDMRARLTGEGSKVSRMIDLFIEYGINQTPDTGRIAERMARDGYHLSPATLGGLTATLQPAADRNRHDLMATVEINTPPSTAFEFALGFRLDPRLTAADIRKPFFERLGPIVPPVNGISQIALPDGTYTVEHSVHDATFGNHYFILRK